MGGKSVHLSIETYDKLIQVVELVEQEIYGALPEGSKYYPQITQQQVIEALLNEELTRLGGTVNA